MNYLRANGSFVYLIQTLQVTWSNVLHMGRHTTPV